MRNLIILTFVGGVAGGIAHTLMGMMVDLPLHAGGCLAGAVGYLSAWGVEMWLERKPTFRMDWWG